MKATNDDCCLPGNDAVYPSTNVTRCFGEEFFFSFNSAYEILDSEREWKLFSLVKCPHNLWGPSGVHPGYFYR